MRALILFLMVNLFSFHTHAQDDLLILKKNNRTVKTFYPGTEIDFSTATRYYEAYVTSVANDSVYLVQYDIRRVMTNVGAIILDTVAQYHFGVNYHDILSLQKKTKNFNWGGSGAALFGGGAVLTVAGLATWIFSKPNTRYYARPAFVIGSAAIATIGYFMMKSNGKTWKLGKKYSLHYIKMK